MTSNDAKTFVEIHRRLFPRHRPCSHRVLRHPLYIQDQLMLTNPRDAFRGQSRSPNMVLFDMFGKVSY